MCLSHLQCSFNAKPPDPRDRQSRPLANHMVLLARKVTLDPLSNTKNMTFTHIVGTDRQKRLFFTVKKKKDLLFFFSVQMYWVLQHSARPTQYLIEITQEEDTEGKLNSECSVKVHLFYMRHTICLIPTCISGSLETFKLHL